MPSQDSTCLTPSGLGLKKALTPTQKQKLGPRVSNPPTHSPQNDSENPNSKSPSQHESSLSGYQQVQQSIKDFFALSFSKLGPVIKASERRPTQPLKKALPLNDTETNE